MLVRMTHLLYLSMYFHICRTLSVHKESALEDYIQLSVMLESSTSPRACAETQMVSFTCVTMATTECKLFDSHIE